jgi:hypothetical protein
MGAKRKILFIIIMLFIGASLAPGQASAQGGYVSMQVFYDELSPYGTWVVSPDYGYVWIPDAGPDFSPYSSDGYWVITNQGWTWVSYYSWGWAPFHYGRWYYDPYYGHMWVPDNEWGPGWVTWRRSGDYYGWAPIGPGISISIAYSSGYYLPDNQWTFVSYRDFGRRNIKNYYVNTSNNVTIINNSTVINNTYIDKSSNVTYNTGPDRAEVEQKTGKKIIPVTIQESSTPGQSLSKDQLHIYKPQVKKNVSTSGKNPAPSNVKTFQDVKPPAQSTGTAPKQKVNQPAKQEVDQPVKQQPAKQQVDQPGKQQPAKQQNIDQPAKEQPAKQQQQANPAKQQTKDSKKAIQPNKTEKVKEQKQPKQHKNADSENPPH